MVSLTILTLLLATNTLATDTPAAKDPERFIVFFCNRNVDKCPHRREITSLYENAFNKKRTELVWKSTGYNGWDKLGDDWGWVWSTQENSNYELAKFILNTMGYSETQNMYGDVRYVLRL